MSKQFTPAGKVSELYIYPVKALAGIEVNQIEVDENGPRFDRRWMIVKGQKFVSQRQLPMLSMVKTAIDGDLLRMSFPEKGSVSIPLIGVDEGQNPNAKVSIWGDEVDAIDSQKEASSWLSECMNEDLRFVYMSKDHMRVRNKPEGDFSVGFADGYPFLITNTKSLSAIQAACKDEILMSRFRSNIVFEGSEAFEENKWKAVQIGDLGFDRLKLCERCIVTTINQETGEKGKDPLKALSQLSSEDGTMIFGQNMIAAGKGSICIGEEVLVR